MLHLAGRRQRCARCVLRSHAREDGRKAKFAGSEIQSALDEVERTVFDMVASHR